MSDFIYCVLLTQAVGLLVRLAWISQGRIPLRGTFDTAMEILISVIVIGWGCLVMGGAQ